MDIIDGLRAFVVTVQTGSFTGAAHRLGISNRLTSKYVAELEARLGVRLLQRTTRKIGLTPAGEDLMARAPLLIDDLDELLGAVAQDSRGFTGVLRISAPVTFGEIYVYKLLARFAAPHSDLTIDLRLNDSYVDLARNGIDLAFRIGAPAISSAKARKLGTFRSHIVCSPDYLKEHSAPRHPNDLLDHVCIVDSNRRHQANRWTFLEGTEERNVAVKGRFIVNSAAVARDLAHTGQGIANCPTFVLEDDIETGRLVELLPDWGKPEHVLNAVYLDGHTLPRKTRALIDFAVTDFRNSGLFSA